MQAPHFTAALVFKKRQGYWLVMESAPILRWLLGKRSQEVKAILSSKGWKHTWVTMDLVDQDPHRWARKPRHRSKIIHVQTCPQTSTPVH